jgi:hypothetical protein
MLHGAGIFTNICPIYDPYMEHLGHGLADDFAFNIG